MGEGFCWDGFKETHGTQMNADFQDFRNRKLLSASQYKEYVKMGLTYARMKIKKVPQETLSCQTFCQSHRLDHQSCYSENHSQRFGVMGYGI